MTPGLKVNRRCLTYLFLLLFLGNLLVSFYSFPKQQSFDKNYLTERVKLELTLPRLSVPAIESLTTILVSVVVIVTSFFAALTIVHFPKDLFVSVYERNVFYQYITIHAP